MRQRPGPGDMYGARGSGPPLVIILELVARLEGIRPEKGEYVGVFGNMKHAGAATRSQVARSAPAGRRAGTRKNPSPAPVEPCGGEAARRAGPLSGKE